MVSKVITSNFEILQVQIDKIHKRLDTLEKLSGELLTILKNLEGSIAFLNVLSAKINTSTYEISNSVTENMSEKIAELINQINANIQTVLEEGMKNIKDSIRSDGEAKTTVSEQKTIEEPVVEPAKEQASESSASEPVVPLSLTQSPVQKSKRKKKPTSPPV